MPKPELFRPTLDTESDDPLIGAVVTGRYQILQLWDGDKVHRLYVGTDIATDSTVGIRVAERGPAAHSQMLSWIGQAMLTICRHAILDIGHIEDGTLYVVLSEAALDIVRKPQQSAASVEEI